MKRTLIGGLTAATVLLGGLAFTTIAAPAAAADAPPDACYEQVQVTERRYHQPGTPGVAKVAEYRWEAVFKKGKELKGWYVTGTNDWHQGDAAIWYELPEHKQPERFDNIAPTGTVPLSTYGGPQGQSAQYRYGESYNVFHPGPDASVWTTDSTPPAAPSGSSWGAAKTRTKPGTDIPAIPEQWFPSQDGWTRETKDAPWVKDAERTVTENGAEKPCPVPNRIETSHEQFCGGVKITLRNISPWIYPTSVEINGVHSYGPTVDNRTNGGLSGPQKDQSATRTITFPEDSGDQSVRYRVQAGSERDLYVGLPVGEWTELTIDTDCEENPSKYVEHEKRYGDWQHGDPECGDTTNTKTRTVELWKRTVRFELDDNYEWQAKPGEWKKVKDLKPQSKTYDIDPTECPPVTTEPPTTTEPPVTTEPPTTTEPPVTTEPPTTTTPPTTVPASHCPDGQFPQSYDEGAECGPTDPCIVTDEATGRGTTLWTVQRCEVAVTTVVPPTSAPAGELPTTGSESTAIAAIASALLAGGFGLLAVRRKFGLAVE